MTLTPWAMAGLGAVVVALIVAGVIWMRRETETQRKEREDDQAADSF